MSRASLSRQTVPVVGFDIDDATLSEAVGTLRDHLEARLEPVHVTFVNAHYVNCAARSKEYARALRRANVRWADGSGMRLAARLTGHSLRDNVNGTDLFPLLCEALENRGFRVFLFGGRPGVAERVREWIGQHYPNVTVCGTLHGYESDPDRVLDDIRRARPDLLLVGLGAPLQDMWIRDALPETGARILLSVGGLLDFFSGDIPRAPKWVRVSGCEWCFRLFCEPARLWKRYLLGNVEFVFRAVRYAVRPALGTANRADLR